MKRSAEPIIAVFALWLILMAGFVYGSTDEQGAERYGGEELVLQSFNGPLTIRQLHGRIVLLFFGFTSCPDVCPMTLSTVSRALSRLSAEELAQVATLFISVDPQKDTPELLNKYTGYFHENIIGATADHPALKRFVAHYGAAYQHEEDEDSALGYAISHTPDILFVDRQGQLLDTRVGFPATVDEVKSKIKGVLSGQFSQSGQSGVQ